MSACGRYRGEFTGTRLVCSQKGCTGEKRTVRWSDGKITYPCSKGITWSAALNAFKIND